MATRAIRAGSIEHVQALNLIELFFDDKSEREKAVRNAWALYFDFLTQPFPPDMSEVEAKAHNDKGIDLLVALLEAMAKALGYDFNKVQLKRGAYYPQSHLDDSLARTAIRDNLVKILSGTQPIPMAVVSFPVSDEAMKSQQMAQAALLKTLSGEKPLKVKTES